MTQFVHEHLARLIWLACGTVGSLTWEVIRAVR